MVDLGMGCGMYRIVLSMDEKNMAGRTSRMTSTFAAEPHMSIS